MLIVRPIPDPNESADLCRTFGKAPDPDNMVYLAVEAESKEDRSPVLLGLCRFTLKNGKNEIVSLDYAEGTHDTEALIITARAVMNFAFRCSVKTFYASDEVPDELSSALGFRRVGGRLAIDLEEFYKSPCNYRA